jgi:hypothetical protein
MGEKVTLELPEDLARQVKAVAERTQRSVDDVLLDWVRRAGSEPVLELLPDGELLAVCDSEMAPGAQEELSDLLDRNREGELTAPERGRLEELMGGYRAGLVRKAQALKVAVQRGLRPGLG